LVWSVAAMVTPSDAAVPGPSVTAGSEQIVNSHSGPAVTMQYSGVDAEVDRFSCSLDGQAQDCSGPQLVLTNLAPATHTFSIRGYDTTGLGGPRFVLKWIVDPMPDTQINAGPADGGVAGAYVKIYYSSSTTFTNGYVCTLDERPTACEGVDAAGGTEHLGPLRDGLIRSQWQPPTCTAE
jgi:hypothetical protein